MLWTVIGAGLVLYECWATSRKHRTISTLAHRWPWGLVIVGWWAGLGIHLWREWRRDRTR